MWGRGPDFRQSCVCPFRSDVKSIGLLTSVSEVRQGGYYKAGVRQLVDLPSALGELRSRSDQKLLGGAALQRCCKDFSKVGALAPEDPVSVGPLPHSFPPQCPRQTSPSFVVSSSITSPPSWTRHCRVTTFPTSPADNALTSSSLTVPSSPNSYRPKYASYPSIAHMLLPTAALARSPCAHPRSLRMNCGAKCPAASCIKCAIRSLPKDRPRFAVVHPASEVLDLGFSTSS